MNLRRALRETRSRRSPDLWPELRARLAADDLVELRLPPVTWPVMAATAAAIATLLLVPEPVRFLTAFGAL